MSDDLSDLRSSWDAETLERIDRKVSQLARVVASRADLNALRAEVRVLRTELQEGIRGVNNKLDEIIGRDAS